MFVVAISASCNATVIEGTQWENRFFDPANPIFYSPSAVLTDDGCEDANTQDKHQKGWIGPNVPGARSYFIINLGRYTVLHYY